MQRLPLDGLYGTRLAIDLCRVCQGFWFDGREHLQLAPGAILQLFEIIHDANGPRTPLPSRLPCPRCGLRLLLTDDRQRATRFRYWRCARDHGRYITFVDFLREKDFVRELDPAQLAELKAQVRSVACSSCGAPVDLARDTVCSHCHTPLAMLDVATGGACRRGAAPGGGAHGPSGSDEGRGARPRAPAGTSAGGARLPSARDAALGHAQRVGRPDRRRPLRSRRADPPPAVVIDRSIRDGGAEAPPYWVEAQ